MIRAGREEHVLTSADLAQREGLALGTWKNRKAVSAPGRPAPVSSKGARTLLWDGDQQDAWAAGRPVPPLPAKDDPGDWLDRQEAAASLTPPVDPRAWDSYARESDDLRAACREIGGVDHWPRGVIQAWEQTRPGDQGKRERGGRPRGTGDLLPREEIRPRAAELLTADPAVTAHAVADAIGVHPGTATMALAALRADAVAVLLDADPQTTAADVVAQLGYRTRTARSALRAAQARR
ncbi:hypothetical protein OG897_40575 [Streptomyces sp. NBC_00237]|uniref:hypothetical protein n=1 Tax=Streptomyces sp. NBC_00237 TaxID=2975687 RepID=UPI00225129AE|nr:hypothetical protein [Streptomyces sp. NBC_00237]MCX5207680.1 hypothetical protein [Streptomyces sp. NBC_00237]